MKEERKKEVDGEWKKIIEGKRGKEPGRNMLPAYSSTCAIHLRVWKVLINGWGYSGVVIRCLILCLIPG